MTTFNPSQPAQKRGSSSPREEHHRNFNINRTTQQNLGNGNFGTVFDVEVNGDKGKWVAKSFKSKEEAYTEFNKLNYAAANCKNIVKPLCIKEIDNKFCIIMEKARGIKGTDFLVQDSRTEEQTVLFIKKLFLALDTLHKQNISHGDIKLDNIFFDGQDIQLIDFGFSKKSCLNSDKSNDIMDSASLAYRLIAFGDDRSLKTFNGIDIDVEENVVIKGDTVSEPFYTIDASSAYGDDAYSKRIQNIDTCMNLDEIIIHILSNKNNISNITKSVFLKIHEQ